MKTRSISIIVSSLMTVALGATTFVTGRLSTPTSKLLLSESYTKERGPIEIGERSQVCSAATTPNTALVIRARARIDELSGYPNLFQSSDGNSGFRVEINDGVLGLVLSATDGTLVGLPVGNISVNQEFSAVFRISNSRYLAAQLNGTSPVTAESSISMKCDRLIVGRGFSVDRVVNGRVSVEMYREGISVNRGVHDLFRYLLLLSIVGFVVLIFRAPPVNRDMN